MTDTQRLLRRLRPFQIPGARFLDTHPKCILGDEPGLGKTVQTLAWLHVRRNIRPAVIVCPAKAKAVWCNHARDWLSGERGVVLHGETGRPLPHGWTLAIVSYDTLRFWLPYLTDAVAIVGDEIHRVKNRGTKRTRSFRKLCRGKKYIKALSGTPIVNRPAEFFSILNLLDPVQFDSFWDYAKDYCDLKKTHFGWDFRGASNTEELFARINGTLMLRRKKKDVLKDLPEKVRAVVPIELSNRPEYKAAEQDFDKWLKTAIEEGPVNKVKLKSRAEVLKSLALWGKIDGCIDWIEDFLESGEKLVVFTTHHWTVDTLAKHFRRCCVVLDGRTRAPEGEIEQRFQTDGRIKLLIGNIQAAGESITLTAASNTAFVELGWTPGEHRQAEDRVHRIGTTADSVTAWYCIAEGTIEEDIIDLLEKKQQVLDKILDGQADESEDLLGALLERMKQRWGSKHTR